MKLQFFCFRLQRRLPAHPNVVHVADAFQTPDEIVAVAEFVPGELHKQFDIYKASCGVASKGEGGKGLPESRLVVCICNVIHRLSSVRR